ncbi:MAG: ASCH domain-containing protein [Flexilinea sp.]
MKAISIRQPWAWLIVNGIKTVENRTWKTNYRGRLLIHASTRLDFNEADFADFCQDAKAEDGIIIPADLPLGGIVGAVDLIDCVENCEDAYDESWHNPGQWAFVLRNPEVLPFAPVKGKLNLWNYEP